MQDSPGSFFEVTLSQAAGTTTLFTTDLGASGWRHQPIDLSPWAGQTVTLTFLLHQEAGGTLPELDLDEVSLGDWLTPRVSAVEPVDLGLIHPPVQLTIHGENFISKPQVWIDSQLVPANQITYVSDTNLTVTLTSASLPPGGHTLKVVNPGGQAGALAGAFQSGAPIFLPLIRR